MAVDPVCGMYVSEDSKIQFIVVGIKNMWFSTDNAITIIAIQVFVSVVVIACPCAIGLAAPITLLISSNESSRNGILIKNSSSMDRLSKIDTVIFDKTGTITDNEPEITAFTTTGDKHLAVSHL